MLKLNSISRSVQVIVAFVLLVGPALLVAPASADGPESGPRVIGRFERVVGSGDLTEDDVREDQSGFVVERPAFANTMAIEMQYLEERLGFWSTNHEFKVQGGRATFDAADIQFEQFLPSQHATFSFGSPESILFDSRPMWVSVHAEDGAYRIEMDDGRADGQRVFLSAAWLDSIGVVRPRAVHEDGTELATTPGQGGWWVDVHHFSSIVLFPWQISVRGHEVGGTPVTHPGTVTWDSGTGTLAIDVGAKLKDYKLYIEKDWFDVNLPHPGGNYRFVREPYAAPVDLTLWIPASETPATVSFQPFGAGASPLWSFGKPGEIETTTFNGTLRNMAGAAMFAYSTINSTIVISAPDDGPRPDLAIDADYLESLNIEWPYVESNPDNYTAYAEWDENQQEFRVYSINETATVKGNGTFSRRVAAETFGMLSFNASASEMTQVRPLFEPWIGNVTSFYVDGLPWNTTMPGQNFTTRGVALAVDGVVADFINFTSTHAPNGTGQDPDFVRFSAANVSTESDLALYFYATEAYPTPSTVPNLALTAQNVDTTVDGLLAEVGQATEFTADAFLQWSNSCSVRINRDQSHGDRASLQQTGSNGYPAWSTFNRWMTIAGEVVYVTYENSCIEPGDPGAAPPILTTWDYEGTANGIGWIQAYGYQISKMQVGYSGSSRTRYQDDPNTGNPNPNYHRIVQQGANVWSQEHADPYNIVIDWRGISDYGPVRGADCDITADRPWYVNQLLNAIDNVVLRRETSVWERIAERVPLWVECSARAFENNWNSPAFGQLYGSSSEVSDDYAFHWVDHKWYWGSSSHAGGWASTRHVYEVKNHEFYSACEDIGGAFCNTWSGSRYYTIRSPERWYLFDP